MKVLIIDADWRFTQQAEQWLEAHAHDVVWQNDPAEAKQQIERSSPELVILAAELATDELAAALDVVRPRPAVLLTEEMARFDRAWRAWQKTGDELLMKPVFSGQDLQSSIVAALENAVTGRKNRQVAKSA